jgi:hypothetical protein
LQPLVLFSRKKRGSLSALIQQMDLSNFCVARANGLIELARAPPVGQLVCASESDYNYNCTILVCRTLAWKNNEYRGIYLFLRSRAQPSTTDCVCVVKKATQLLLCTRLVFPACLCVLREKSSLGPPARQLARHQMT